MANHEQLAILRQGADVWNKWREENWSVEIDLTDADLSDTNLVGFNLREAKLFGTYLIRTNLSKANLIKAFIFGAFLDNAVLLEAYLSRTILINVNLSKADLAGAKFGSTIIARTDLSETRGLESVIHDSPSTIGADSIQLSRGEVCEEFLRGCGLSDLDVEYSKLYNPNLNNEEINKIVYKIYDLRATQALQISPLFISYSHVDKLFVDCLDTALTEKGIRFWRDIHDATAGRLETQIDHAIRQNPTVLLILSKNSIKSDWVEHEVRTARKLEKELGRDALCPIALDDSWKSSLWPKRVMEQVMEYNILDFSDWENISAFEGKFAKLLNGLDLFYKKAGG